MSQVHEHFFGQVAAHGDPSSLFSRCCRSRADCVAPWPDAGWREGPWPLQRPPRRHGVSAPAAPSPSWTRAATSCFTSSGSRNTFPAATSVAIEKARTAATFRKPTREFESAIAKGRTALVAVDVMTPLQGGVPILVNGAVIGAIGVSGAMNAQQDDDIATLAAERLGGASSTAMR